VPKEYKPKVIKGLKVKYNDKEYSKITSISRGYDYSSFHYLDENDSECSIYLAPGQSFAMVNE
jgi:hypothetical protein